MSRVLELAPASYTAPDRPSVIDHEGGRIYLHIHDAEYFRQRSAWRVKLREAHPDHGGTSSAFRRVWSAHKSWRDSECVWYARLGLLPPDGYGKCHRGIAQNIRQRALLRLAARNPTNPNQEEER
jgi:hypothetical protein